MAMTRDSLRARIETLPRVQLGHFPTPLEYLPRLTEAIGGPRILIKRDDCSGLAFGGNKTRQLEFTIGQGIDRGADVLIGGAGSQSNHCRQLSAGAAKLGVKAAIAVVKDHKSGGGGNLLLDDLLGAEVEVVDTAGAGADLWGKDQPNPSPMQLWNAMIYPLLPMRFTGAGPKRVTWWFQIRATPRWIPASVRRWSGPRKASRRGSGHEFVQSRPGPAR